MRLSAATASIAFAISLLEPQSSPSASELRGYVHVRQMEDRGDEVVVRIAGQILNEGERLPPGATLMLADPGTEGTSLGTISAQATDTECFWDDVTVPRDALLRWQQEGEAPRLRLEATDPYGVTTGEDITVIPLTAEGDLVRSRVAAAAASTPIITTFVGGGPDGIPAAEASLRYPEALAADAAGHIYVAARYGAHVFRIDPTGRLTVMAGNGGYYTGPIVNPAGLAVDTAGNLLIADAAVNRIYRVNASTGAIEVFAGKGVPDYSGDGGPAKSAAFFAPSHLAFAPDGGLLVTDRCNHRIRRIDAVTNVVTTVAGSSYEHYVPGREGGPGDGSPATAALLDAPGGVAVDPQGNLFIADTNNQKVRRVDAATGIIDTWVGTGQPGYNGENLPRLSARLNSPRGLSFAPDGDLLIADLDNNRLRRVDAQTGLVTTAAGDGQWRFSGDGGVPTSASLKEPIGVLSLASGDVLIADGWNLRVRRISAATGLIGTLAGNGTEYFSGDGHEGKQGALSRPAGLALDREGNLLISDTLNQRIRKLDRRSRRLSTIAGIGPFASAPWSGQPATEANIGIPDILATDPAGRMLYFTAGAGQLLGSIDLSTGSIVHVAGILGNSEPRGDGGPATLARFYSADGIAVDSQGNVYVADSGTCRIRRIDATTGLIDTVLGGLCGFTADGSSARNGRLSSPRGLAFDPDGDLLISEGGSSYRVRKVNLSTGIITTVAGNGMVRYAGDGGPATSASLYPAYLALDKSGNLLVTDAYFDNVRRVDHATGTISTVAGGGPCCGTFSGDGGPAAQSRLYAPVGIAVGDRGDVLIADSMNERVRRVAPPNTPPQAHVTGGGTFECTSPNGQTVPLDASGSSDSDSSPGTADDIVSYEWLESFGTPAETLLSEGPSLDLVARFGEPRSITLKVTDSDGAADTADTDVSIVDTTPPALSMTASPSVLWPPNHRMVEVTVSALASDACGAPSWMLQSAASDEADDTPGSGDGATTDDLQGADPGAADASVMLRAERRASGPGRTYTLNYQARDASGNAAGATVVVTVPHDRGGLTEPIDLSLDEGPAGTLVSWRDVPGAVCFDVVRGVVGSVGFDGNDVRLGDLDCLEACSTDSATRGDEDVSVPPPGAAWFYLVESVDASGAWSSLGTESASRAYHATGECR